VDSNAQKERDIQKLVAKTTKILENFAPDQLSSVVSNITSKIVEELQNENNYKMEKMHSSLKESLIENSKNVDKLEQIIIELKHDNIRPESKEYKFDQFNKTASFKLDAEEKWAHSNMKDIIEQNCKEQVEFFKKKCDQKKMSHTEYLLKKLELETHAQEEITACMKYADKTMDLSSYERCADSSHGNKGDFTLSFNKQNRLFNYSDMDLGKEEKNHSLDKKKDKIIKDDILEVLETGNFNPSPNLNQNKKPKKLTTLVNEKVNELEKPKVKEFYQIKEKMKSKKYILKLILKNLKKEVKVCYQKP